LKVLDPLEDFGTFGRKIFLKNVKEVECPDRDVYDLGQEQLADSCEQVDKLFATSR
jgi:hypothetical protein